MKIDPRRVEAALANVVDKWFPHASFLRRLHKRPPIFTFNGPNARPSHKGKMRVEEKPRTLCALD
jgi:hypothetical protein